MDSINFDTFDSPAGGVELSDTLSSWRKKTNGIVVEVDSVKSTAATLASTVSTLDGTVSTLATTVATSAVNNNSLALGKIAQISNLKVLGNTSGSTANVSQISVLDQDTLSSNSATSLATQQSIKAYVDNLFDEYSLKAPSSGATGTFNITGGGGNQSWTEIDLSGAVGANKALVVMSIQSFNNSSLGAQNVWFRTKGSGFDSYISDSNAGAGAAGLVINDPVNGSDSKRGGHIVIMTDSAGKIEGRSYSSAIPGVEYAILAFQKQRV